jgi:cyclohexanecarboxylate-CoA ligase/acyl-CoA synthetase
MPTRVLTPALVEEYYRDGAWQERKLYEVVDEIADRRPDAVAVVDQHERLTYRELSDRSSSLARWLLDQALADGDAVAIQSGNRTMLAVGHLACGRVGATFLPLATTWRQTEIAHLLRTAKVPVVVVPGPDRGVDFLEIVQDVRGGLPDLRVVAISEGDAHSDDVINIEGVLKEAGERVAVHHDPDAPRYVMVTSGTTGMPSMGLWTDNNLWIMLQQYIAAVRMDQDDVTVGLAPGGTGATGYLYAVLAPLLAGATSVLLEHWDPRAALDLIESERATTVTAVPAQSIKLLQDETIAERDFSALRAVTNAGAALAPDVAVGIERTFGCRVNQCYGATDGGTATISSIDDPAAKRHHTIGRPLAKTEIRLLDADRRDVDRGGIGEITWRGPTKTTGYLNDPERDAAMFFGDGWYTSGDLGQIDEDGYLHIVGRSKDLIIRGGQNISPRELEDYMISMPGVSEVAVVGVPDPVMGERTCAVIVPRPGAEITLDAVVAYLEAQQVARFKLPERLELRDDLPRGVGGKVTKNVLRDELAGGVS